MSCHCYVAISELAKVLEPIRASCSFQVKRFRLRAIKDLAKTTRYVMELNLWFSGPLVSDKGTKKDKNSISQQGFGV